MVTKSLRGLLAAWAPKTYPRHWFDLNPGLEPTDTLFRSQLLPGLGNYAGHKGRVI